MNAKIYVSLVIFPGSAYLFHRFWTEGWLWKQRAYAIFYVMICAFTRNAFLIYVSLQFKTEKLSSFQSELAWEFSLARIS